MAPFTRPVAVATFLLCLGIGDARVSAAEPPARPNVLLILADDLGYSD